MLKLDLHGGKGQYFFKKSAAYTMKNNGQYDYSLKDQRAVTQFERSYCIFKLPQQDSKPININELISCKAYCKPL